ncbi:MAG: RDD family protein [Planctomycetes bacterium]|nr:RDD family protein [Planctomycetota bacterium]
MSTNITGNRPIPLVRRVIGLIAMAFLSTAIPIGILWWSLTSFVTGRPTGRASGEQPVYSLGSLHNGELWYPVFQFTNDAWVPPFSFRIVRLNLETGVQRETGITAVGGRGHVVWAGDDLYVCNPGSPMETDIYRVVGTSLTRIGRLTNPKSLTVPPFLWNGHLTTVVQTSVLIDINGNIHDDKFQLVHLVDGAWVAGRKILLPGIGREWYDDPQRDRLTLRPRTSMTPGRWSGVDLELSVIVCGDTVHLFYCDNLHSPQKPSFAAYRNGFEFADDRPEVPSALAPDNANREVSGWEPIQPSARGDWWVQMACSRQGAFFEMNPHEIGRVYRFARSGPAGRWEELSGTETACTMRPLNCSIIADPTNNDAYIVRHATNWNDVTVCRIDGTTILPPHLSLPATSEREYLSRLRWLFVGFVVAWLVHCTVLIGGTDWLTHSPTVLEYEFGHQQATIAPTTRRALALVIDGLLLLLILLATISLQARLFGLQWQACSVRQLCDACVEFEWDHFNTLAEHRFNPFQPGFHPVALLIFARQLAGLAGMALLGHPDEHAWRVSVICGIVLVCSNCMLEGRLGTTLGKCLLGLRTVRTTLRPCNAARALIRTVLYFAEILFLVTPLAAVTSMVFSRHRQRLGDRVADTIVIDAGSIRPIAANRN